jgi:hypothetical protein
MRRFRALGLCAGAALLAALGVARAQPAPDAANPQNSVKLTKVILAIPAGTTWLKISRGTVLCFGDEITRTSVGGRQPQDLSVYSDSFRTELERAGYKVVSPEQNLFDREAGSADYEVGASSPTRMSPAASAPAHLAPTRAPCAARAA